MIKKTIFVLLVFILGFCSSTAAYTLEDVEWVNEKTKTLEWGSSAAYDDYVITARDFDYKESGKKYVSIEIKKSGERKKLGALTVGDTLSYRDEQNGDDVRVIIKEIKTNVDDWTGNMEDPTAKIQIQRRGLPDLKIHINTEKNTYDPKKNSNPSEITANLKVENKGNAKIEDVNLNIDTDGLELVDGELDHQIESIDKGETSEPVTIKMEVPHLWDKKSFDISADANGNDINSDGFDTSNSKSITINKKWELVITKTVTEEIYVTDTAYVRVNVRNDGLCSLDSIKVHNPVTDKLEIKDNITHNKTISLEPGESTEKLYSYSLRPLEPGEFNLPDADAGFTAPDSKKYTVSSGEPEIKVNGPYIILNKSVNSTSVVPGGYVKVTVEAKNTGNKNTHINVSDTDLPPTTKFVDGNRQMEGVVKSGKSKSFSYTIKLDEEGDVKLPAASLTFVDMEGYSGKKISDQPEISVTTSANTEKQSDGTGESEGSSSNDTSESSKSDAVNQNGDSSKTAKQPGFKGLLAITMFICIYYLQRKRNR
ncbi:MAG: CARDB domain-containing protein [Methanohalobium sp.]|uniref:COG1470 family protein n=1 Tax=Methanohalobium sp. TaxID=2837493 RepID=UPI00397DDBE6